MVMGSLSGAAGIDAGADPVQGSPHFHREISWRGRSSARLFATINCMALLLVACAGALTCANALARERLDVVFLNPGKTGETYWDMVSEAMCAAATQLDVNLETVRSERNHQAMRRLGLEIVGRTKPPDYLILVNEEAAATPIIEAANKAGVKTFLLSSAFAGAEAQKYGEPRTKLPNWIGSLEPDMRAAGERMARGLIEAVRVSPGFSSDGKIHLLGLAGDDRTSSSIARTQAFAAYAASRSDVVVDRLLQTNWNAAEAETLTDRYLTWAEHAGIRPAGVWAATDPIAHGAIEAIKKRGLVPGADIGVVGLDWSPDGLGKVEAGEMISTDGGHFLGGAWSIVMLRDYADGCDFARQGAARTFPMASVDRSNVSDAEKLVLRRRYDRVDFSEFLASGRRACGVYDFSLDAVLRAASAAVAQ